MIINADRLILGRMAAYVAKQALLGEKIVIVNSEKAVITGKKDNILKKWKEKDSRGDPHHGPFIPKTPAKFVRRVVRGMLPYKKGRGSEAFKRVKCYIGETEKGKSLDKCHVSKMKNLKYVSVGDLCKWLK